MPITAIVFDLGGVVFDSPVTALRALERERGLAAGAIGAMIKGNGNHGAFAALERGELDAAEFFTHFDAELQAARLDVPASEVLDTIESAMQVRPAMLDAVRHLRRTGFAVAALTNNARTSAAVSAAFDRLHGEFDVFVESCRVGSRKPEPAIYHVLGEAMQTPFEQMIFLDDLGANLKTARSLGLLTIKVTDAETALQNLDAVLSANGHTAIGVSGLGGANG